MGCYSGRISRALDRVGSTIIIPAVIALVGACVSTAIQESQKRVKYIEIAVGVLDKPPSQERKAIREWAIEVMAEYSAVEIGRQNEGGT